MDAQVGKVTDALKKAGIADKTIVIFTSDHGYHLGEHDFWAKVSLGDESAQVPLIISVPGKEPAVCDSFVELLDLYPTLASLCGLDVPDRLQGPRPDHVRRGDRLNRAGHRLDGARKRQKFLVTGRAPGGQVVLYGAQVLAFQHAEGIGGEQFRETLVVFRAHWSTWRSYFIPSEMRDLTVPRGWSSRSASSV